jgi:hypothetical protein
MMRRLILAGMAALTLSMAMAGASQAATPFTAGSGSDPDVAVGFDGSAHVVWTTAGANTEVGYCRVSPVTEACGRTELLEFPGAAAANASGRATVFVPAPNKVVIVAGCWNCPGTPTTSANKAFRWISTDNGSTFAATQIGREFELHGVGAWLDDANLFVAANSNSAMAQSMPTLVGAAVPVAPTGYFFDGEVVRVPGTGTLVGASNDLGRIGYRAYDGALSAGAINNVGNWSAIGSIGSAAETASESSLNAGGGGATVVYRSQQSGATRLALRGFDPGTETFGAPTFIQGDNSVDAGLQQPDGFQDLAGRLYVVWQVPGGGGLLRYRAGLANGTEFGAVGTLASGENFTEPEVAVGNETGYVVWTQGSSGLVRVVLVDPRFDVPPSSPGPSSPGPSSPGPSPGPTRGPEVSDATIVGKRALRPGERATIRFVSSAAGQAVLTIEKQFKGLKGKRKGKRVCLPQTKKRLRALRRQAATPRAYRALLRKRTCRAYRRIGEIRKQVSAGVNTIVFGGRVAGRKLGRGTYRAKLVVTDSAGQPSRTETLRFKVVGSKGAKKPGRASSP